MRRWIAIVVAGLALVGCVHAGSSSSSSVPVAPSIAPDPAAAAAVLPAHGTLVVRARGARFRIYEQPGAGAVLARTLVATNDWAQPLWLPAVDGFDDAAGATWYEVRLPVRPNGTTGWVPASGVVGRDVGERLEVDLSEHRLWRFADGGTVASFKVGIGTLGVTDGARAFLRVGARALRPVRSLRGACAWGSRGSPTSSRTGSAEGASRSTARRRPRTAAPTSRTAACVCSTRR